MKMSADSVLGEASLPGLQRTTFFCVLTWPFLSVWVWNGSKISLPLLIRPLIPSWSLTLRTSSNPNYLPQAPPSNTITLGVRAWTHRFGSRHKQSALTPADNRVCGRICKTGREGFHKGSEARKSWPFLECAGAQRLWATWPVMGNTPV